MSDHDDKLREAIKHVRNYASVYFDRHLHPQWDDVCAAAESTLPKMRTVSVYLIIGTSRLTGKVCVSQPIYGVGAPLLSEMQTNFTLTCDHVRLLGPFPQEVPA